MSLTYLKLEIKKMFKKLPELFLGLLIFLGISLAITAIAYTVYSNKKEDFSSYKVGLVQDKQDKYTTIAMEVVQNLDIIKKTLKFTRCTQDEAYSGVKSGKYDVVFIFPDGFADNVMDGEDSQIEVRYGDTRTSTIGYFMKDVSTLATNLIIQSERSIFALKDYYDLKGLEGKKEADKKLNLKYFDILLSRNNLFNSEIISSLNTLDMATHFFCVGLIMMFLLLGTSCAKILSKDDLDFYKKIRAFGISSPIQILIKLIATLCLFFFIYMLLLLLAFAVLIIFKIDIGSTLLNTKIAGVHLSLLSYNNTTIFVSLLKCSFILIPIAAFLVCLYEITPTTSSAVLSYFILSLCLAFASGFFFPDALLPSSLTKLAAFTYTKNMFLYTTNIFYDSDITKYALNLIVHSLVFVLLAALIRERNLNKCL